MKERRRKINHNTGIREARNILTRITWGSLCFLLLLEDFQEIEHVGATLSIRRTKSLAQNVTDTTQNGLYFDARSSVRRV